MKRYSLIFPETRLNKDVGRVTAVTFVFWAQRNHDDLSEDELYWQNYLFSFLSCLKIPSAVSPAHNKDINEIDLETGVIEYKFTHWHVVLDFGSGNNKTIKQVFDLLRPIRDFISITPWDSEPDDKLIKKIANDFDVFSEIFSDDDDLFDKLKRLWLSNNISRKP